MLAIPERVKYVWSKQIKGVAGFLGTDGKKKRKFSTSFLPSSSLCRKKILRPMRRTFIKKIRHPAPNKFNLMVEGAWALESSRCRFES